MDDIMESAKSAIASGLLTVNEAKERLLSKCKEMIEHELGTADKPSLTVSSDTSDGGRRVQWKNHADLLVSDKSNADVAAELTKIYAKTITPASVSSARSKYSKAA